MNTIDILGVPIAAINMQESIKLIENGIKSGQRSYVNIVNVHSIMEAQDNKKLMESHRKAFLCTPDGMPTVWVGKYYGHKNMQRVYGPDLMEELIKRSVKLGYSHFFFGGKNGVPDRMRDRFLAQYPGLRIVGVYSPPFRPMTENEEIELRNMIENIAPDIFWVSLGCPKQEIWMTEHVNKLNTKIMIGVGAAFDFHAGLVTQAPDFVQNMGFEWLFRLCVEPRRLWNRYLKNNPRFIFKLLVQILNEQ